MSKDRRFNKIVKFDEGVSVKSSMCKFEFSVWFHVSDQAKDTAADTSNRDLPKSAWSVEPEMSDSGFSNTNSARPSYCLESLISSIGLR